MANVWTIGSTATRHMLDANIGFGIPSERYNVRDKYRREYSKDERTGAGLGTTMAIVAPVASGAHWVKRGMPLPAALSTGWKGAAGRAAGIAALGAMTAVGVKKTMEITEDDGNLAAVGTGAGLIGGTAAGLVIGKRFAGKYAPLVSGAGMILGAVGGRAAGGAVGIGPGHIGEEHVQAPRVDRNLADRAASFATGGFNAFFENGPTTQGMTFGKRWGMDETIRERSTNAERSGAMNGDLAAAGILGGGALAVSAGLQSGKDSALRVLNQGILTRGMRSLEKFGTAGIGAAAVGITALATAKAFQSDAQSLGTGAATAIAAGTVAATAGTAALVSRSAMVQGMATAPKVANSMLAAAALIGVLSAARMPIQQFVSDAKAAHAVNGQVDGAVAATATAAGGLTAGTLAARKLASSVPADGFRIGKFHIPKGVVVGVGTAVAGVAAGAAGYGLSATMPDIKTVAASGAAGAAAGAGIGRFAHGIGVVPGVIGGALVGMSVSGLLKKDD